jgi:hypothetical protein
MTRTPEQEWRALTAARRRLPAPIRVEYDASLRALLYSLVRGLAPNRSTRPPTRRATRRHL